MDESEEKGGAPIIKQSSLEMDQEKEKLRRFQKSFHVRATYTLYRY